MERECALELLETAVERVVEHLRDDYIKELSLSRSSNYYVKFTNPSYTVYQKSNGEEALGGMIDIDFVRLAVYWLDRGDTVRVKELIGLENQYSKHVTDMMFYVHGYKSTDDAVRKEVMIDRFELSKYAAHSIKSKIGINKKSSG